MRRWPATTGARYGGFSTPTCTGRDRMASRSAAGATCWHAGQSAGVCRPAGGSSCEMVRSTGGWLSAARLRAVGLVRRSGRHCGAGRADGRSHCGDHQLARRGAGSSQGYRRIIMILLTAAAGGLGSVARFELDQILPAIRARRATAAGSSTSTVSVCSACRPALPRNLVSADVQLVVGPGFLGGKTTVSAARLATVRLRAAPLAGPPCHPAGSYFSAQ